MAAHVSRCTSGLYTSICAAERWAPDLRTSRACWRSTSRSACSTAGQYCSWLGVRRSRALMTAICDSSSAGGAGCAGWAATNFGLTGGNGTVSATTSGAAAGLPGTNTTFGSADASTKRVTVSRSPLASLFETTGATEPVIATSRTGSTGSNWAPVSALSVGCVEYALHPANAPAVEQMMKKQARPRPPFVRTTRLLPHVNRGGHDALKASLNRAQP